jgi:hypothetical protein
MDVDETTPDISENGRRRDGDRWRGGSNEEDMLSEENEHKPQVPRDRQGDGGGDGGGGPSSIDSKWDSPLHRTRIKLRLKLASGHAYAVTFGYTSTVRGILNIISILSFFLVHHQSRDENTD